MVVIKSLEKHKYYVSYYIIIHSGSFNVSATGNKEGISTEYLDIKGQKTPTSYSTLKSKGDSSEYTPALLENQSGTVPYLLWAFVVLFCLFPFWVLFPHT